MWYIDNEKKRSFPKGVHCQQVFMMSSVLFYYYATCHIFLLPPYFLSSMVLIKHQWLLFLKWCPKRGNRNKHKKQAWSRSKKYSILLPCNVCTSAFGIHIYRDLDTSCPKRNIIIVVISVEMNFSYSWYPNSSFLIKNHLVYFE